MSQHWPLSQEANKESGICSVCRATRQLHIKDGTVHKHGPRDNPCSGSNKLPLAVSGAKLSGDPVPSAQPDSSVSAFSLSPIQSATAAPPRPVWSPISLALVRHIPRSARPACATHLSKLFRSVVAHPEVATNWLAILEWGGSILAPPIRGGKRHNFASVIKKCVSDFSYSGSNTVKHARDGALKSHSKSDTFSLAQAVAAKLEDGNLRAAIRLLNSDDTPAAPSEENLRILQDKHPLASGTCVDLLAAAPTSCLVATDSEVRQAVLSFPAGSSGGPDGLRPQHLKELVLCRESGSDFLGDLTAFVNMVLAGSCPKEIAPYFFGGRLLALSKKSGGLRPIAIGLTLRRLVSKCASSFRSKRLASVFLSSSAWRGSGWRMRGGCALSSTVSAEHAE